MTGQRQREITEWADAAFGGPWTSNARGVARMLEEVAELVTAVTTGAPPERVAGECADVMICAFRLAAVEGFDLEAGLAAHTQLPLGATGLTEEILYFTAWVFEQVVLKNSFYTPLVFVASRLRDLCRAVGRDLLAEVDAKMEINRRREWVPDGTGCGRHVKTTTGTVTS
mgnify:CR=1 FL=1